MEQRGLGRTGVSVSKLCLGAMMFGDWGTKDHDESIRIIHRALDAGVNFIDTADVYSQGESEIIVGEALAGGRRDSVVLASKVHGKMGEDPNEYGNSRRWIMREVEASLKRLQTDWIDLYQVHRWDPWTDHEETLGALSDLVEAKANFERAVGRTLEINRVTIASTGTKSGSSELEHDTLIPGTLHGQVVGTDKIFTNSTNK